ncbi:MAG: O-Antigen ligase [Lentisphaerae bacterium ADurb.Bin242]|nr:MAG: O-Antigen ligase [Lentisphaerae bacterium ADurb.Bin242]
MDEVRQKEAEIQRTVSAEAASGAGADLFSGNIRKTAEWVPVLFLFLTLLRNPTLYTMPGHAYNVDFFTLGTLSLAAVALLFSDFRRLSGTLLGMGKIPLTALLVFFGIAAGHFLANERLSIQHLGEGLRWISIPLLVCVYYDSFRKLLPAYFSILCLLNLFYTLVEVWRGNPILCGISGNINWNVSLIVMTTPFLLYCLWDGLRNRWKLPLFVPFLAGGAILAVSAVFFVRLDSRAGFLMLPAVLLIFGWLKLSARSRRIALFAAIGAFLAGSVLLSLFFTGSLGRMISEDDRLIFYEGAVNMIADHPVFGVGDASFEDRYVRYRPLEYFFTKNVAPRSDHPHNHFLYIACSFGMIGLCAWLCLLLIPAGHVFLKLYRREPVSILSHLYFFALLYTLFHASLDLVFFVWPNALVSLMILGLFWHECFVREENAVFPAGAGLRVLSAFLAVLIAGWSLFAAVRSVYSSYVVKRLMMSPMPVSEMASGIYHTARRCPAEYAQNYAMLYLTENILNYPELTVYLADIMRRSNIENYPGVHMGRGNAMFQLGCLKEAYESYQREAENFPMAVLPVHNMILTAERMGDENRVRKLRENLAFRLSTRNINPQMYEYILKNPNFDLVPWAIPKKFGGPGGQYGVQK